MRSLRSEHSNAKGRPMTADGIPMKDILENSAAMLCKRLYAIRTFPSGDLGAVLAHVPAHLEYQVEIERRGDLFAAGPLWTENEGTWKGEGLIIVRAGSHAEAEKIAAADPMHRSGARKYEIKSWLVNEGGLTVRVNFSDQKATIS